MPAAAVALRRTRRTRRQALASRSGSTSEPYWRSTPACAPSRGTGLRLPIGCQAGLPTACQLAARRPAWPVLIQGLQCSSLEKRKGETFSDVWGFVS